MKTRLMTTALLVFVTTLGSSQVVASIDLATDYSFYNAKVSKQLSNTTFDADIKVRISTANYSSVKQKLAIGALDELQLSK